MGVEVVGSVVREGVEDGVEVVQYGHFQWWSADAIGRRAKSSRVVHKRPYYGCRTSSSHVPPGSWCRHDLHSIFARVRIPSRHRGRDVLAVKICKRVNTCCTVSLPTAVFCKPITHPQTHPPLNPPSPHSKPPSHPPAHHYSTPTHPVHPPPPSSPSPAHSTSAQYA